jgi:hypothetical protein
LRKADGDYDLSQVRYLYRVMLRGDIPRVREQRGGAIFATAGTHATRALPEASGLTIGGS